MSGDLAGDVVCATVSGVSSGVPPSRCQLQEGVKMEIQWRSGKEELVDVMCHRSGAERDSLRSVGRPYILKCHPFRVVQPPTNCYVYDWNLDGVAFYGARIIFC